jgi:non-canonical purine NTP pyrophosphatase (RdgB/HAM1 family)
VPKLFFITGSVEKFEEARLILPQLERVDLDLPEIQEIDQRKIISAKLKAAALAGIENIIVEDTGLYFQSLSSALPGPLIKWFVKSIGNDGLVSLAHINSSEDNSAYALTTIGYLSSANSEALFFEGRVDGTIVKARGSGFGWDAIFQPKESSLTLGELAIAEKTAISHRGKAFKALAQFLQES